MPAEQSSAAGPSALPDEPPSSVTELSLYDAGVTALSELHDLPSMTSLRSLNLHSNRVARISHLEPLVRLRSLNLSSNQIEVMEGLHALRQLEVLDLSCNRIRMIDGLAALGQLRRLLLGTRIDTWRGSCGAGAARSSTSRRTATRSPSCRPSTSAGCQRSRGGAAAPRLAYLPLPGYRDHVLWLPRLRRLDGKATAAADFATAPAAAAVAPRPRGRPSRRRGGGADLVVEGQRCERRARPPRRRGAAGADAAH